VRKIVIDCDPGHDDAMAILMAHGDPTIDICAITTVAGNQTLEKTTLNARRVCTVAGITDVPIAAGCDRPLLRKLVTAGETHGESGLDGPSFGEPTVPVTDVHAIDLIIELVMASPGEITLVPTGPLTNIAMALRKQPRLAENVREVVLMGGAYTRGNSTPAAEFNIFVDPEAAAAVFDAGWPLTMIGLDLTHQALATPAIVERISALGTPISGIVVELIQFFTSTYARVGSGLRPRKGQLSTFTAPPIHDACCIARIIRPELVSCVETFVAVETSGSWSSGMTLVDFDNRWGRNPNALVATELDFNGFWDLMISALDRIGCPEGCLNSDSVRVLSEGDRGVIDDGAGRVNGLTSCGWLGAQVS
jgi:inosine/uridine nucleosidase